MHPRPSAGADDSLVSHRLGPYEVVVATDYGPRVIGLRRADGPEVLAQLGNDPTIDSPGIGTYTFRGGHRLWAAPEIPSVTYAPDDHRCEVMASVDGLTVSAPMDAAGFEKEIRLGLDGDRLTVDHRLVWKGETSSTQVAPWAITQLPLGGVAILPVSGTGAGSHLQPESSIVVWPYTRLDDPRIGWTAEMVRISAGAGPRLKLGSGPNPGALGYLAKGQLFVKRFDPAEPGAVTDRGAIGQVFVDDRFSELESVGALIRLEPGAEARHRESWEVVTCSTIDAAVRAVAASRGS